MCVSTGAAVSDGAVVKKSPKLRFRVCLRWGSRERGITMCDSAAGDDRLKTGHDVGGSFKYFCVIHTVPAHKRFVLDLFIE